MTGEPRTGTAGDDDSVLADLVAAALEQRERGETVDLAAVCRAHPDLAPAVAEALGLQPGVAALHAQAQARDPLVGRVLAGRYRVGRRLGAGAMGAVYEAFDQELDRTVAVKVLHAAAMLQPERQERFRREARALAAIASEFVVPVYDRGVDDERGLPYLVMARLHGVPFAEVLRLAAQRMPAGVDAAGFARVDWLPVRGREPTCLRQMVRWAREVAEGLAAAHAAGVHHRDVKPSNVFLTADGRAVLVDFGIASAADDGALTASGTSLGTPWYMAPEQAAGDRGADAARIDVYGLGATLYHALALVPPFEDEPARVLHRLQREDPPRLSRLHPGLHRDLAAIVECAMARAPRHRYGGAAAFAADLDAFLENRPVQARPLSAWTRTWRRAQRRPAVASAAALAVAVAVLGPMAWMDAQQGRAAARVAERDRLLHTLPATLGLDGARGSAAEFPDLAAARAQVDAILALDPAAIAALVRNAALREDAGEPVGAVRAGLPAGDGADARYVEAFLALRERTAAGIARADELLAALPDAHHAGRELRLLAQLALAASATERGEHDARNQAVYDASLALEWAMGSTSTTLLHVRGAALVNMERYAVAVPILQRALDLNAAQAGVLANLGICLRRLGRSAEARAALEQALALRPALANARQTLSQVLMDAGDFDAALAVVAVGAGGWRARQQVANVHLNRALAALRAGDRDTATRAGEAALAEYRAALADGAPAARVGGQVALAEGLVLRDDLGVVDGLVEALRADPLNPAQLQNLAATLPDVLGAGHTEALRELLLRLAVALSPDDAGARAALERALEHRK